MFVAWGDESGSLPIHDPGAYLLSAVLTEEESTQTLRESVQSLKMPAEKKIHWHSDDDKRRMLVIETIAELPIEAVVVVRVGSIDEGEERRRRKCFERFAVELDELGCSRLTLESRGRRQDQRDMTMLDAMRSKRRVSSALRLTHTPGPADPALWVADALCGAVVAHRVGNSSYLAMVEQFTNVIIVEPA